MGDLGKSGVDGLDIFCEMELKTYMGLKSVFAKVCYCSS
jgi:hypothetical protein